MERIQQDVYMASSAALRHILAVAQSHIRSGLGKSESS
jgi:hypothetical protein